MTNGVVDRRALLALAAMALAPTAWAQTSPVSLHLPLQVIKGKIFVDVTINGRPIQAMVDSGAAYSGINTALADELGVQARGRKVALRHVHGGSTGRFADGVALGLGSSSMVRSMLVTDFSLLTASVLHPIQVVLGADVLAGYVSHFDFDANLLTLFDRRAFAPAPGAAFVELQRVSGGTALVKAPVMVEGQWVQALLDTGSQTPLIVSASLARRLGLLKGRAVSTAPLGGFGGTAKGQIASLRSLSLGGRAFADTPVRIAPRGANLADPNLGLDLLSRFNFALDLTGLGLWLWPRPVTAPFEKNLTGFYGITDGDTAIRVTFVAKPGPAEAVGLREGDIVTLINGQPASTAQVGLLNAGAGTPLILTLQDGQTKNLVLAPYY